MLKKHRLPVAMVHSDDHAPISSELDHEERHSQWYEVVQYSGGQVGVEATQLLLYLPPAWAEINNNLITYSLVSVTHKLKSQFQKA